MGAWNGESFGGITPIVDSFAGPITYVPSSFTTAHPQVVAGDWVVGTFSYAPLSGKNGLYNYTGSDNTSGYVPTFSMAIYTVTTKNGVVTLQSQVYSDAFTGNTGPNADYYAIQITYHAAGPYPAGSTMNVMSDSVAFQDEPYSKTGVPAINLSLTNPTNGYDSTPNVYTASNLPLPDQTTLTDDFSSYASGTPGYGGKLQGVFTYDPDGTSLLANVNYTWNPNVQGQPTFYIPEPPGLVMGVLAIAVCTAAFSISRRKLRAA